MGVTIEVDELLAARLRVKAAAQKVSLEVFARDLLGEALQRLDDVETWEVQNRRRIDLIKKSAVAVLSESEQYELQTLQDAADRRLEARDRELLAQLDRFKHAVEQLPPDTTTM
jgi:plasmid stability protein